MLLHSLFVFTAAFGGFAPAPGPGEDAHERAVGLVVQVNDLNAARQYASAAKLAAGAAADEQLDAPARVLLGGLARENYEAGGTVADLCGLVAVMRIVAPLAKDGGALHLEAAREAEARLEQVEGAGWRAACGLDGEPKAAEPGRTPGAPSSSEPPRASKTPQLIGPTAEGPASAEAPLSKRSRTEARRFRAGVGTLVPGLLLFVPMAAVLAHRARMEGDLRQLHADTAGRKRTEAELDNAVALNRSYGSSTAASAVLGATGAALTVTGLVLLATGRRPSRVAVAPWGARGVGGLSLAGRF